MFVNIISGVCKSTPLIAKVIMLYLLFWVPLYAFVFSTPAPVAVATNDYLSELAAIEQTRVTTPETITGSPIRLVVPRLNIDLPIEDGIYDPTTDSWTLSRTATHYALITAPPNTTSGNTLIYGHNNRRILGATRNIQPGDVLQIITKENQTFSYAYTSDIKVDPSNTSIFGDTSIDKPRLTLLTCDGLFNEQRRLMSFDFTEVSL